MFEDVVGWDFILLVLFYIFFDEVEKYIFIKYNFFLRVDFNFIFIFMRDGEIYKRDCGVCCNLNIFSLFKVVDGIMVIWWIDCIKLMRND